MLLLQQVNAVSRTRFQLGKQHRNTQRTKHTRTRKWPIIVHILHEKTQNLFSCAYKSKCEGRCKSNPGTDWNDGES